eukprot:SAG31_NODE_43312_length_267_cov_1.232143_1_plen_26_part_10
MRLWCSSMLLFPGTIAKVPKILDARH